MPSPEKGAPPVGVVHEGEHCRLEGSIDFGNAREVLEAVSPLVERGVARRIDLGGITRSNSVGLALMIEWLAVARRAGRPLEFVAVPEGLRQLADVCQVEGLIGGAT